MLNQLKIQAEGLSGNLDKIWPDIKDSAWSGGDKDGWERVPYWLDGFIPLAYLLKDEDMISRAKRYIDAIIENQKSDGWLCPCPDHERGRYDMWAYILICKVLVVYYECSKDDRIEAVLYKALKQLQAHIKGHTLFNWGASRWFECLIPIFWLYERTGEEWLINLAHSLRVQGIDWEHLFANWSDQLPRREWSFTTHVVNIAMCLKSGALMSRITGGDPDAFARNTLQLLEKYHGMPNGHFSGDECLSGTSPIQGTELCGVVEAMYSYEQLLQISGSPEWGDRLEYLTFNALPATISPDMWTHQYDQQTNQVECSLLRGEPVFRSNGPDAHLFGLEPNYGCCTANFNQGWPKFALSTFMKSENGIVSTALAPSSVETKINGVNCKIQLDTLYPFRDTLTYTITTDAPVNFESAIRIPAFAKAAYVDGSEVRTGEYHKIRRTFEGKTTIDVKLEFEPELIPRPNDMYCLRRGPLLYSVYIKEKWIKKEYTKDGVQRKFPYCDYEIYAKSKWNYAFASDSFEVAENDNFDRPFSPENAPISITADMVEIDWDFENGLCFETPRSRTPLGKPEKVKLIPYGCTNLRMTEMPYIK